MKEITIGRLNDNTIVLDGDKVSRHHCRCYIENGKYYIVDTKSTNGVFLDGKKIDGEAEFVPTSKITIGNHEFAGEELISYVNKSGSNIVSKCSVYEEKYQKLADRYYNNVELLLKTARIESYPYTPIFPTDDEKLSYMVEEYNKKMNESVQMLKLITKSSRKDALDFRDDMDAMASIVKGVNESQKETCMETRQRLYDAVERLQQNVEEQIIQAFDKLWAYYDKTFCEFYETSLSTSTKWAEINNNHIITTPYVLVGHKNYELPFFEKRIKIQQLQFIPFLKRNNLIVRYSQKETNQADSLVNGIVSRLMAGSQSGNIQLHMVDMKDLGGTSNMLKMLDRHVFTIYAKISEVQSALSALDEHVEDVVQNLLQGACTSLEAFNLGKEKQEPYQLMVLKNFPFGMNPETAHTILRILANGVKAGVHFIFMVNSDYVNNNDDCRKISNILHLDDASSLNAQEIDLTSQEKDLHVNQFYAELGDNIVHKVVQYINSGFEMKKDEVLRLTDYMIPKEEWWSRHSANRADIPFGMSINKQIQKLNITQESGQNSAIVIGIPGSGKSVFLHVLIANAMVNYSPKELQMYLLDFSGVEFDVYARHKLPHARVIAPEAEREFGLSILREVFEEGNRRMTLCRENGVTNIVELKQKDPELVVPRLLVIIDEFQKIFEIENDKISQEANSKIHAIIQEYRKFGINLILATQKLPAKSVVPYDLIANRVVFKSDPNDFNNLIRWSHSTPQPRLLTGNCIYNNESGSEFSNYVTRSFFINASNELENLLDEVHQFAQSHPDMVDKQELRTFRSDELPEFADRILSERHIEHQDAPREVGVYMGESIAIAPCHVYVPLTKDSNNNILIIGGQPDVAKGIAYHTMLSEIAGHTEKSCSVIKMNFMMEDDPMQELFQSDMFAAISDFCNMQDASKTEDVLDYLQMIKNDVIDARKNDSSLPLTHVFINIFEFQRGRMFDGTGGRGDMQSECSRLLEYILKNGPMVGVFTVIQVDNLANLSKLGYSAHNMFNHRIALQMSEQDSDKLVGNSAANKLLVLNRPATKYRGLYYNHVNNSITKFKPYYHGINSY